LIGAAVTGGPPVTSVVVLSVAVVSVWDTVNGAGPFAGTELHQSLILLQAFMGVLAVTAMLLAAAIAEQQLLQQREKEAAAALRDNRDVLSIAMRAGSMGAWSRNTCHE
jgi:integral membrane sensor domain MASE1